MGIGQVIRELMDLLFYISRQLIPACAELVNELPVALPAVHAAFVSSGFEVRRRHQDMGSNLLPPGSGSFRGACPEIADLPSIDLLFSLCSDHGLYITVHRLITHLVI